MSSHAPVTRISWADFSQLSYTLMPCYGKDNVVHINNIKGYDPVPVIFQDDEGESAFLIHSRLKPVSDSDCEVDSELLDRVRLAVGTVLAQVPSKLEGDTSLYLNVDFGSLGMEKYVPLVDTDPELKLVGRQIVCLYNLAKECIYDPTVFPFSIREEGDSVINLPYEVVGKVANGTIFRLK